MFKTLRILALLLVLLIVSVNAWLSQSRSTDWNNSLYVKIYPINADGSSATDTYIRRLSKSSFDSIEEFLAREAGKYGKSLASPVRMELGTPLDEHPPALPESPSMLSVMWWSLKLRFWADDISDAYDRISPDVQVFVRYHSPQGQVVLENSIGLQKGMVGIVNAYASRQYTETNNVIIAHEFLHTLGATDKYRPQDGQPTFPLGFAEPEKQPLFPQRLAEIMGGRIPSSENEAMIPKSLDYVIIGSATASEIRLQ